MAVCPRKCHVSSDYETRKVSTRKYQLVIWSGTSRTLFALSKVYKELQNRQVEQEILTKLINISKFALSGHNFQPVKWLVKYETVVPT